MLLNRVPISCLLRSRVSRGNWVGVGVNVEVGVGVGDGIAVEVGVGVGEGVKVRVRGIGVGVRVDVGDGKSVGVARAMAVGDRVGVGAQAAKSITGIARRIALLIAHPLALRPQKASGVETPVPLSQWRNPAGLALGDLETAAKTAPVPYHREVG